MKTFFLLLVVFVGSTCEVRLYAAAKTSQNNLHQIILTEFEKFKTLSVIVNFRLGALIFSSSEYSHESNANYDIILNEDEIANYVLDSSLKFKSTFVKFVIAHEIGHNIQIAGYRPDVIARKKGEGTIFLECDADVLAGFLITQVFNSVEVPQFIASNPNADIKAYAASFLNVMFSVYKRIYEMDKINVDIKTHPSNEDRLMAVRQGIILGNIVRYYFILYQAPTGNDHLSKEERANAIDLYNTLVRGIGFQPNDANLNPVTNPYSWASDEAIRIIHENNSLARNVIRYDKSNSIEWDENSAHPYVNFIVRFLNQNTRPIRLSGYIFTEIVPRKDPQNIIQIAPIDGQAYDLIVAPGQTAEVTGKLKWIADKDYEPHIVLPGDSRSLYWVLDAQKPMPDSTEIQTFDIRFDEWNDNTLNDIKNLIISMEDKQNDLFAFTRGIGTSTATTPQEVESRQIVYQPTFKNGEDEDQTILIEEKQKSIFYQFKIWGPSGKSEADDRFDEITRYIQTKFPHFTLVDLGHGDTFRLVGFHHNGGKMLRLYMKREIQSNNYTIQIQIIGKLSVNLRE